MTNRQVPVRGGFLGRAIAVFAVANSAAVDAHRHPGRRHFETLGIAPQAFSGTRQR